jgi:hypothetical protein
MSFNNPGPPACPEPLEIAIMTGLRVVVRLLVYVSVWRGRLLMGVVAAVLITGLLKRLFQSKNVAAQSSES